MHSRAREDVCQALNRTKMSIRDKIAGHAGESEKALERRLVRECEKRGWLCLKYSNTRMTGYPDRLVLLPGGRVAWVEVKSRGRRPTAIQLYRHAELRKMGHTVHVVDSVESMEGLLLWEEA